MKRARGKQYEFEEQLRLLQSVELLGKNWQAVGRELQDNQHRFLELDVDKN